MRWGIMGTGAIAAAMADALGSVGSPVMAVGSARPGAAETFAAEWNIPHALPSHRAVAEHPEVDAVYVATTNDRHHRNVLDAVAAGTPVLCEKPIALNTAQATDMLGAAVAAGVFSMEAMWMRFQPFLATVDDLIAEGTIGEVVHVSASLGFPAPQEPARRWMNRELGGGSLLDLGIYPLTLAHHLLGPPEEFSAAARIGPTGVDLTTSVISHHAGATSASLISTFAADLTNEAVIAGTAGRLRIHSPFHHSSLVTLERRGDVIAPYDTSPAGHGFRFEIAETERCLEAGLLESPMRPHADTLAVLEWMDAIRARCGIAYPQDPS
jgi:predicted dehydrogenase